jgi:hypothetical protein
VYPPEIACTPARSKLAPKPRASPAAFHETDLSRKRAWSPARRCTPRRIPSPRPWCWWKKYSNWTAPPLTSRYALQKTVVFTGFGGQSPQSLAALPGASCPKSSKYSPTPRPSSIQSVQACSRNGGDTHPPPPKDDEKDPKEGGRGYSPPENECTPARVGRCSEGAEDERAQDLEKIASVASVASVRARLTDATDARI